MIYAQPQNISSTMALYNSYLPIFMVPRYLICSDRAQLFFFRVVMEKE